MTYKDALAVIQQDLNSGKITQEEARIAREWLTETVRQANARLAQRTTGKK